MANPDETPLSPKSEAITKIAHTLAERRQMRGISIEKASQATKIRGTFLKSLEQGDWDQLPGDVYVRGFVTRYAQFLGLKPDELLAPYFQVVTNNSEHLTGTKPPLGGMEFSKSGILWVVAGLLAIVIVLQLIKRDRPEVPAPDLITTPVVSATPIPALKTDEKPKSAGEHELKVYSPLPLWLSVKAQNRAFEGFLPQNSTWTWRGEGAFVVRLGHSQQVVMHVDGKPVRVDDKKSLVLSNEN